MLSLALAFACSVPDQTPAPPAGPHRSILTFSKTTGFRHDSIPFGRKAILDIAAERGWSVTFTEDADYIDSNRLKAFDAVVFLSTTGTILNKDQEKALMGFIHGGG